MLKVQNLKLNVKPNRRTFICILVLSWMVQQAQSACSGLDEPNSTRNPTSTSFSIGEVVNYACVTGYTLTGSASRTCQSDTSWTGSVPGCTINVCASPNAVPNASRSPDQATYNYTTTVSYTCDTGYSHTSGDLTRTCQADTTWSGSQPVCTINVCASPNAVPNSSRSPDQATYNYTTTVSYTCGTGYSHTSGDLTRTCQADTTWSGSQPVCTINACASPNAVPNSSRSPDQATYNYTTTVSYTCDTGYSHTSGDLTRTCQADTTWSGSQPVCTINVCASANAVPNSSRSPDQATYNYTTTVSYTCGTGYSHTSGDLTRTCQADTTWSGSQPVCTINVCASPNAVPNSSRSPEQVTYNYTTTVSYTCDTGYSHTSGDLTRTCQADTTWSGSQTVCIINACASPNAVPNSSRSPDQATYNYTTTVSYTCDTGYSHTSGDLTRTCQADTTWSGSEPVCTINVCASPNAVPNSSRSPDQATYNYTTTVSYTCGTGYSHTSGDLTRTCQADTTWSGLQPVCTINICASPNAVPNSSRSPDQATYNYTTTVSYTCDTGYSHTSGDLTRTCQADTTWSGSQPVCTINVCASPNAVPNSSRSPDQATYNYTTTVSYACDTGYSHTSGDLTRTCQADTTWSGLQPVCTINACASPNAVPNSSRSPDQATYNYTTTVSYTCDTGYSHTSGDLTRTCQADTTWSGSQPVCTINTCAVEDVPNSSRTPTSSSIDYGSSVTYVCNLKYDHTSGDLTRNCQADTTLDGTVPVCTLVACAPHPTMSYGTVVPKQSRYLFGESISISCNAGYYNGNAGDLERTCLTSGVWNGTRPYCFVVKCPDPAVVPNATFTPAGTHKYGTSITYTCDLSFNHTAGNLVRTCQQDFDWSGIAPVCTVSACIKETATFMTLNPDTTLHAFGDVVTYECILGYNHTSGDLLRACQNDGSWAGTLPACVIVKCHLPAAPDHTSITPTDSLIEYNNVITYACDLGYNRTAGDQSRTCMETGLWSGTEADCTLITCDPPPNVPFATYQPVQTFYNYSTVVTYQCDFGYYKSSGSLNSQCTELATWTNNRVCSIVECTASSEPHSSYLPSQSVFDFNETITYTCDIGHNLTTGNDVRKCQNDATWDGLPPVCSPVVCAFPEVVEYSTMTPTQASYVYLDWIIYACVIGYEMTSGNSSRQCDEHAEWTGTLPNCTIKKCVPPDVVQNATYTPVLPEHNWNTSVTFTCDAGYEHDTGDETRTCLDDKTWSGTTSTCKIKKCPRIDVQYMTLSPADVSGEYDYLTQITYACVVGYNHSYGDLHRTCLDSKGWSGNLPNCTIVTCNPPASITNTHYIPDQAEYIWQDEIYYGCDPQYHFVSGINYTTCNESGEFPPVNFDCSVMHSLTKNTAEPAYAWINETSTSANILFDFDGMCDVTLTASPMSLGTSHVISGNTLTVTVTEQTSSVYGTYVVTLNPFRLGRTFGDVSTNVYYGREITGLQGWINNPINTLMVNNVYEFEVRVTDGTTVQLDWDFDGSGIVSQYHGIGIFSSATQTHNFTSQGEFNVTITASNAISSQTVTIPILVIYGPNNIEFIATTNTPNTTQTIDIQLVILTSAFLPIHDVNITVNLGDGSANLTESRYIGPSLPLPTYYTYSHLYPVQGDYYLEARVESSVGFREYSQTVRVWDPLVNLDLVYVGGNGIYITNATMELEFVLHPEAGFLYTIDYGDGTTESVTDTGVYVLPYNVSSFTHAYASPGVYVLQWTAQNGLYSRTESKVIIVQNPVATHSYTLEPVGKKYPWSVLQVTDIPLNVTLNDTVAIPTNVTCDFDAGDGTSVVNGLEFLGQFFQHLHRFLVEGVFQPVFNCSNLVSNYEYVFNVTVLKYQANFTTVVFEPLVPLNISDSVTVFFHIENDGFAWLPYGVTLTFNFGNGVETFTYDTGTYSRLYSKRGDYYVIVTSASSVTGTSDTDTYPLRLGVMYFDYNSSVAFINDTLVTYSMRGVLGSTTYTVDFTDGSGARTCDSTDITGCEIHHLCPRYGNNTNVVSAFNGTFVEIDEAYVVCDNPINVTIDHPTFKAIPDGIIDLKLRITENDLYIPNLFCEINMGDPIEIDTYIVNQTVTFADPFNFTFQYIALGRHGITMYCWNLINETQINSMITLTNKDFLFLGSFDRQYSQAGNALPLTLMRDVELFSRLVVIANLTEKYAVYDWQTNVGGGSDRYSLLVPFGQESAGGYKIILRTYFREEVTNAIFEPTHVRFIAPSPQVHVVGGRIRRMPRQQVILDAQTLSYDPVNPGTPLTIGGWACLAVNAGSFIDAENQANANTGVTSCALTSVDGNSGMMSLDLSTSPVKSHYVVTVNGTSGDGLISTNHQIINVVENTNPLTIRCLINCLSKVAVTSYLQVSVDVDHNCPSSFSWTLQEKGGSPLSLTGKTETGLFNRTFTIKPNSLFPGKWYVISLLMTYNGGYHGPAYHEFLTNQPPQGGECTVYQFIAGYQTPNSTLSTSETYETTVGKDEFNITCSNWMDEEFTENTFTLYQPLFYYFYLQYGPTSEDRQVLYFDPGSTSNLVSLRIGNPDDGFKATLVLRIADIIGDYTEISYNMIVKPPPGITTDEFLPLQDDAQLALLTELTDGYEKEIVKANRTWDYRTLSRKIQDVASVYNQLILNSTATITLNPDDLLTLGNQRNKAGDILSWNEYWNLIVDVTESEASNHLMKYNERLTAALYYTVSTWPANKRIPLVSIEVISKGLSATLEKTEYANITAAIQASYCANKMAEDLVLHTLDREFPPTEQLISAMSGVFELNMNILQLLQTVLTPNLPEDPTMDEMRTYLEYIKTFEGSNYDNQSFLSLQEQTFLAQKQLQKYHLQKYLKSEASKTALPNINFSLGNLENVLKSMSSLGRLEQILDNDFTYLSVEKARAYELQYRDIVRPRVVMQVKGLSEVSPGQCNASEVTILTTIFKFNPYFWGTYADRITSYVTTINLDGAILDSSNIVFRIQNYITPPCRDATPTYDEDDENKMIYILLDRRYKDDDILLFIRPDASELTYEVFFNEGEKPDVEQEKFTYRTNIQTDMWTQEDGYKLLVTSQQYSTTGQIWIALRPLLGNSDDESLLKRPFCARIVSVNCVVWKEGINGEHNWDRHTCEVSELSSRSETVCNCRNTGDSPSITIGTTFYVPESKVDFQDVDDSVVPHGMGAVYGLIYTTLTAYALLALWLWREDLRDPYKWSYTLMIDNDIADQHFYIIRVYTGMRSGSGTKSRIGFILAGENTDTGIRILDDPSHLGFERGSVRTFIMGTRRDLGELISIRVWHDDSGVSEAAWYLNQITVTNLNTFQMCGFHCDAWFDYDKGDQRVDRVFTATPIQKAWSFKEMTSYMMAEHHAWISTFLRPFRSSFTRIQRLSCLMGMIYLNMFLTSLFMKSKTNDQITKDLNIGPFRFSTENFEVAIMVVSISTVIMSMTTFLFRYARGKNSLFSQDNSVLVRQYKRLNARYKFDSSVLNLRYPPAENAVAYDYNFLPHFVVYISWTLIVLFVALGLFVMLTTPSNWPEVKSEEWMTTVIVSGLVSFIMIEIVKVILIIIPYLLLCKRAYEPPRPYIDVETLKEIAKYNSASLTMSPDSIELQPAMIPDEDTLIENKRERMNNHQLLKMFSQLALYSGILFIVYTISYAKRDPLSYSLKKNIEDRFNMTQVKDVNTYIDWLTDRFVDQYFSHSFYGKAYTETDIKPFAEDLVNYRVGPARLRQLRIESEPCQGPLGDGETCYTKYKDSNLDTQDYCLGWKYLPCDVSEKSDYFSSPAWEYLSASEVWGFFTMATYATYGGGGYFMKLDVNKDVCIRIFDELVTFQWFDRKTRASILEFTLYNANSNLFVYSKFVAEFPEVGGVISFTDVQVFRLYNDTGEAGETIVLLEFLFTLLVLGATMKIVYEIATDGCKYFKNVWNLLDFCALLMSYTTIIVYIYKLSILELTIATFHEDKNAYVGFENLAFYDYFVNTTHALLVFILSVRVSKILGYSGKINEMAAVVSSSANDLGGFLVIFAIAYFAYVVLGTELFRNNTEKYKDMFHTYGTLTEAIVGKNKLENILTSNPGYAEFYYFTFVIFVLMTLATLAAAILNFSISNVKEEQRKMAPTNIVEILADRISWLVNLIGSRFSKNPSGAKFKQLNHGEGDEADVKEILEDIRKFISEQIQTNKENRPDVYRVGSPADGISYGRRSKSKGVRKDGRHSSDFLL